MKKRYILIAIVLFIGLTVKVNAKVGDLIYEITKLNITDTENGVKVSFEGWAFIHQTNNFRGYFYEGKDYTGEPTYEGGQEVMIVAEDENGNKTYLKNILYDGYSGANAEKLKKVEDECITELITKIKELGYHTITDGEFRRSTWHLDFMWGFNGVEHKKTIEGNTTFDGEAAMIDDTYVTGKISCDHHPFVDHFKFVKQFEDENTLAKQTIPSPGQFYAYFTGAQLLRNTLSIYENEEAFASDVVKAYIEFVHEIYDAGCRVLQFDDCVWGGMVNPKLARGLTGRTGDALEDYKKRLLELNNEVVAASPKDLEINTHVCRGNYHSTFFSLGAYDGVADLLFGEENVNAYYLEYDDERSGGFKPLAKVFGDKKVVLGLITTKRPELEDKEKVIQRIKEASKYIPLERLSLSPQCGFASCEIGNKLTEEEQWAKLKLVKEIAEEVWG